jgi:hypothetical protein
MTAEAPTPEIEDPRARIWQDDVLERRGFADFLTNALTEQTRVVSERQQRGLTVALDAGWGTGKTFFVKHWAEDLKQRGHPVVFFDAWENDLGEEAAIALMAAIKETIDEWVARMPAKQELAVRASEMVRYGVKELRRAVLPVSKVVASGLLKRYAGIGVKEIFDAVPGDDTLSAEPQEALSSDKIEAGLDKIFESALGEQKKRSEAIKNFKTSMSKALELIDQNTDATLPAFVFVDELDRCRPSYAINLLEEIKHIFGMPNVCFVVSTNLEQLSHSICGVYGAGFNGGGYLKRFFDHEFTLPAPNNVNYINLLFQESSTLLTRKIVLGLPSNIIYPKKKTKAETVALIFDAFNLDLRSQKQVFMIADLAAASIEKNKSIFVLWLFFLSMLIHKKKEVFLEVINNPNNNVSLNAAFAPSIYKETMIHFFTIDDFGRRGRDASVDLKAVISQYFTWSNQDLEKIIEGGDSTSYPKTNYLDFHDELPNPRYTNQKYLPSIANYLKLVKYAGYVKEEKLD